MSLGRKVPGHGEPGNIMLVGEFPDIDAEQKGRPFVGKPGWLLDQLLSEAAVARHQCYVTNVIKYRPPMTKLEDPRKVKTHAWVTESKKTAEQFGCTHEAAGQFFNDIVAEGIAELRDEILRVNPRVIVGLGDLALWALTGNQSITKWRGSELWINGSVLGEEWWKDHDYGRGLVIPVIPTYHPSYVLRVWEWKAAVTHDLKRRVVGKLNRPDLRARPPFRFVVADRPEVAADYIDRLLVRAAGQEHFDLTDDIETRHGRIVCVGLGWSPLDALCVPFRHVTGRAYWPEDVEADLAHRVRVLMEHPHVRLINQNWNYDRQYFVRDPAFGFRPRMHYDTMIGHHLLWPGTSKDLAYQASLYNQWYCYWKDEGKEIEGEVDEQRWFEYNCMDAAATYEVAGVTRRILVKKGFATEDLL